MTMPISNKQDFSSYIQIRKHREKRKDSYEGTARPDPRIFEKCELEMLTQDVFDVYLRRISEDKRPDFNFRKEI